MDLIRSGHDPLYRQIADQIAYWIATGRLEPGTALPSLRRAGTLWGVHLHTVRRAYLDLRDRGLVQIRDRGTTMVWANDQPPSPSLGTSVGRFLDQVSREFGATAEQVRTEIARQAERRTSVSVIECSRTLATSIGDQLARVWQVTPTPRLLTEDRPADEPVVTTWFHLHDLTRGTNHLGAPTTALRIRLSRSLLRTVAGRSRRGLVRRIAICETNAAFARQLAAELRPVVGPGVQLVAHTPDDISRFIEVAERDALKLVSPGQWDRLASQHQDDSDVLLLRYEVDDADVEMLGGRMGWSRVESTARV